MDKIILERLLLDLFKEDFIRNKEYTYISQLAVITIKSLMPMADEQATRIDYTRFLEEFKLWFNYRTGENPSLLNVQGRVEPTIYWNESDDSIISRIIPLVLANQKYEVIESEVVRNVLFTTGSLQVLFESLSIAYLMYLILQNEDRIVDKLKEEIIGFAQVDFIEKYEKNYRLKTEDYPGNYKVNFEREKIHLLNSLNGVMNNRYPKLEDSINTLDKIEPETFIGKVLYNFMFHKDQEYDIPKFYTNLSDYVLKIRKSRIDPDQLQIKEYILPDIFSFNEGDVFFHSLLRESKVIKKEVRGNTLTSLVQTRTGMYLFKR